MKYVYAAIFTSNSDGSYTITFPDLPGCISEGKNLYDALEWAESALKEWLEYLIDKNKEIPKASAYMEIHPEEGQFVSMIKAEIVKVA